MSLNDILNSSTGSNSWKKLYINNLNVASDLDVSGNIAVTGNLTVNGTINGDVYDTSIVPTTDNSFNLGSALNRWQNLYLGSDVFVDGVTNTNTLNIKAPNNQVILSHNGGNNLTINSVDTVTPIVYDIPDVGSNGTFVVANSSNDITVNQLNYTVLNPPVSGGFTSRAYLYSITVAQTLAAAGSESGIIFNNTIYEDVAADVTRLAGDNYLINNTGVYNITLSISDATGNNATIGAAIAIGGNPQRFGQVLSGADAFQPAAVTSSTIQLINASESVFPQYRSTSTSAGRNIGGTGINTGFLSIVRLA